MINKGKGFWRAKVPRLNTKPSNFTKFKSSLNLNLKWHWSENWCSGYLKHALFSSEIHVAVGNKKFKNYRSRDQFCKGLLQ